MWGCLRASLLRAMSGMGEEGHGGRKEEEDGRRKERGERMGGGLGGFRATQTEPPSLLRAAGLQVIRDHNSEIRGEVLAKGFLRLMGQDHARLSPHQGF